MRQALRLAAIPFALLLVFPTPSGAQDRSRPPPPSTPAAESTPSTRTTTSEPEATPSRPPRPPPPKAAAERPPPPDSSHPPPPGPSSGPAGPPPPVSSPPPFWWGFGWGFGFYPIYPEPGPTYEVPAAPEQVMTTTVLFTGALGSGESGAVGIAAEVGSGRIHVDMAADAFGPSSGGVMTTDFWSAEKTYGLVTVHGGYLLLEGPSYGLNLQAGASWLSVPASSYGGQAKAFGLDLGAAAHLGLVGPLGLEGYAHITPFPIRIVDLRAAAAFRVGILSLLVGYRVIDVAADSRTGPAARFQGPEFGLGVIFF
jgi:hypothetical protein